MNLEQANKPDTDRISSMLQWRSLKHLQSHKVGKSKNTKEWAWMSRKIHSRGRHCDNEMYHAAPRVVSTVTVGFTRPLSSKQQLALLAPLAVSRQLRCSHVGSFWEANWMLRISFYAPLKTCIHPNDKNKCAPMGSSHADSSSFMCPGFEMYISEISVAVDAKIQANYCSSLHFLSLSMTFTFKLSLSILKKLLSGTLHPAAVGVSILSCP